MSLAARRGPLGRQPSGVFNFADLPDHVLYFEDSPRRVRVVFRGVTVADSRWVKLLHESGTPAVYYFPQDDVRSDLLRPSPTRRDSPWKGTAHYRSIDVDGQRSEDAVWSYPDPVAEASWLAGYLAFEWQRVDAWFEEDEQVFLEPRDPYHRIDVLHSSRHVRVLVDGETVADSTRPRLLFETGARTRYYLPAQDVRTDLLVASSRVSRCQYKGLASYFSLRLGDLLLDDLVWTYLDPSPEARKIAGLLCFQHEHQQVRLEVDATPVET